MKQQKRSFIPSGGDSCGKAGVAHGGIDGTDADAWRRGLLRGAGGSLIAITVDGKKVTVRTVLTGGEEIDRVVLRDAQGRNLAPRTKEK